MRASTLDSSQLRHATVRRFFQQRKKLASKCDPAIETQIEGEVKGWTGDTIYKLRNGQIWQQAAYHYHYHQAYAPDVTIYSSAEGCFLRVADDDDEAIPVHRLK